MLSSWIGCLVFFVTCMAMPVLAEDSPAVPAETKPAETAQQPAGDAAPAVEIAEPEYAFGEIDEGGWIVHAFKVKNSGDAELKILNVRPG
ncbi:MAG: hypothetical protein SWC40_11910 [Thermodesulfobacteriota bacterium]|nr:hypothetical protein [Thermodesulfobacteriota bacterium]